MLPVIWLNSEGVPSVVSPPPLTRLREKSVSRPNFRHRTNVMSVANVKSMSNASTHPDPPPPTPSRPAVALLVSLLPLQVMMRWNERPRRVLVLLKPEQELLPLAAQTIDYLQRDMGLKVMVEEAASDAVGQVCTARIGGLHFLSVCFALGGVTWR